MSIPQVVAKNSLLKIYDETGSFHQATVEVWALMHEVRNSSVFSAVQKQMFLDELLRLHTAEHWTEVITQLIQPKK